LNFLGVSDIRPRTSPSLEFSFTDIGNNEKYNITYYNIVPVEKSGGFDFDWGSENIQEFKVKFIYSNYEITTISNGE
jgi:hypothetical protein